MNLRPSKRHQNEPGTMKQTPTPTLAICTPVRDVTTPEYDHALRHHSPNATVLQVKGAPFSDARNTRIED